MVPAFSWLVARMKAKLQGCRVSRFAKSNLNLCAFSSETLKRETLKLALRRSSRPYREIAHLRQDAGHLHAIQLRDEGQNFRDELVFHQFADFFLAALFAAAEQFGHGYLQGSRQPLKRRERRRGFLVFDFGNVGPRYRHAPGKLALAEATAQAQRADRRGQVQVSAAHARDRHHDRRGEHYGFRLGLLIERRVAASAIVIDRTELNQQAMIASDDFPRIYWGKSRGHRVVGVPEPATPYYYPGT